MDYFTTNKLPTMALENFLLEFEVIGMMEALDYEDAPSQLRES